MNPDDAADARPDGLPSGSLLDERTGGRSPGIGDPSLRREAQLSR